jgi:hypothetical protein
VSKPLGGQTPQAAFGSRSNCKICDEFDDALTKLRQFCDVSGGRMGIIFLENKGAGEQLGTVTPAGGLTRP